MPFSGSVAGVFLLTVGDTDIIHLSEVLMLLWQDAALTVEERWRTGEMESISSWVKMQRARTLNVFNRERSIMICTLPAEHTNSFAR